MQFQQFWGDYSENASNATPTTTLLQKIPEQPWNESQFGLNVGGVLLSIVAGGGGPSNCATGDPGSNTNPCAGYPKPAWQTGTGVPADGVRDLPDVSLFAAAGANYSGSVNDLPGGTYEIYGTYSGDGTYAASASSKTAITVTPEDSATSLYVLNSSGAHVSTTGPISYGTQLLLEAEPGPVISGNTTSTPTGSITYLNGAVTIGAASVNATGAAELNYTPVPSSTPYSIAAKYSGDASYNPSTSAVTTLTIGKDTPSLSLTSGTGTSPAGVVVPSLTVDVENSANANSSTHAVNSAVAPTGVVTVTGLPSGTLTFPALSSVVDPRTLSLEGVATLLLPTQGPETYTLTISYPGDANYAATTASESITISPPTDLPTTTTATATVSPSVPATPIVTFLVTGTAAGGPPTGTVTFFLSGNAIDTITIPSDGTGDTFGETLSLTHTLSPGANQITASYSGSSVYLPSEAILDLEYPVITLGNGGPIALAAGGATGTSSISVTPAGQFTGAVALSCAVTGTGASAPSCAVTSPLTINGATGASTLAVTSTSTTTSGAYSVTVTGTGTDVAPATTTVAVTVNEITQTPSAVLGKSGSITIASAGGSGASSISVTPGGGFSGSVALACAVTATASDTPICSISPSNVSVAGATAGTATLTVNTTAASAALELPRMRMLPIGGGIAAAALLFFLAPMKRRRMSTLLGALVLIAVVGFSTGCGGGSAPTGGRNSGPSGGSNLGTPAGTYTVTVSGTATGITITPITVSVTVQ